MRRIIALVSIVFLSLSVKGQCIPDTTITTPGFYPDSATGLPHAVVGTPYSAVVQVLIPSSYLTFTVDSAVLDSVGGLPLGFSYQCSPINCKQVPLINGCLEISGPPFASSSGMNFPLTLYITAFLRFGSIPLPPQQQTVTFYSIVVDTTTGITTLDNSNLLNRLNLYPNPAKNQLKVRFNLLRSEKVNIQVSDLLGRNLTSTEDFFVAGENAIELPVTHLCDGIYILSLTSESGKYSGRIAVNN